MSAKHIIEKNIFHNLLSLLLICFQHVGFQIINNVKCTLYDPGNFPVGPICIPDSWKKSDQYRLGLKPSINVFDYGHKDKVSTYVSVTDNCVPIAITSSGFPSADTIFLSAAFFENFLPDVTDPSVFHVPPICKKTMREEELKIEPFHEKLFWREMFTGYRSN